MLQRLNMQLPEWARTDNPVMRYVIGARRAISPRAFLAQLVLVILVIGIYAVASGNLQGGIGQSFSARLMSIILVPTIALQLILGIGAMVMTSGVVGQEKRRQTWDNLRATEGGARLTLRAQWSAAVFYRLAGLLAGIYLVRLVALGALVVDLTAFRGEYLSYIIGGIEPQVTLAVGVIVLALTMTSAFILPLTGLGLDAAFGLLLSTFVQQRVFVAMAQIIVAGLRVGAAVLLFLAMQTILDGGTLVEPGSQITTLTSLGALTLFGGFADWGLQSLHLAVLDGMWALVPFGIFVGIAMLALAFVQALLTDLLLTWSVRRAERRE